MSFPQNQFAHGFQIVKRGAISEVAQGFAHFGERQLWFIAQAEESFGTT